MTRVAMVVALALAAGGLGGCGGVCAEAKDKCEECEVQPDSCDRFDDLSSEDCEAAVKVYEASCP